MLTTFQDVIADRSYELYGRNPDRVVTHWHNLASNEVHVFESEPIGFDLRDSIPAVAEFYRLEGSWLSRRGNPHIARPVAAWLCRRHAEASLRQLAVALGLSRADSVPNLTRRLERRLNATPELKGGAIGGRGVTLVPFVAAGPVLITLSVIRANRREQSLRAEVPEVVRMLGLAYEVDELEDFPGLHPRKLFRQ